jgi:UDP-N-acetylglucosamine 1-carboxyvinyltransferase
LSAHRGRSSLAGRRDGQRFKKCRAADHGRPILADGPTVLIGVPDLVDVNTLALLLGNLGVEVKRQADQSLRIETVDPRPTKADYDLVRRMRASFCVLGPLVARRGRGVVSLPGGCNIGTRPVDLHLAAPPWGADIRTSRYVIAEGRRPRVPVSTSARTIRSDRHRHR